MGERKGTKGLELWCKKMTEGYPGVKIENMTTSWRDGLAFCAIIHHFRPELIDFKKLKKEDVYANNELAFRVAEQYLGVPALLEAEDMVEYAVPDRLSILTYLSQFYQAFASVTQGSPSRIVPKRTSNAAGIVSPASTSPPNKKMLGALKGVQITVQRADILRLKPCAKCTLPVFFAERLNVGKQLYHRTCFRCARCNNQLTLANCYETETPNHYCCETCPDEEPHPEEDAAAGSGIAFLSRSLSDEEKTAGLKTYMYETALDQSQATAGQEVVLKPRETSAGIARKSFLQVNMLAAATNDTSDDEVPQLPVSARPSVAIGLSEHQSDIINSDSGRPERSDCVNSPSSEDDKVQSENAIGSSMVKARMRMFEKKCDPKPTTKVTEIDLSGVTEPPTVPIANEKPNIVEGTSCLNASDQSDFSINVDVKENVVAEEKSRENVPTDSTYESIITVSDETASSPEDNRFTTTEYKTTCEDSIITISDDNVSQETKSISEMEEKMKTCEDSVLTISDDDDNISLGTKIDGDMLCKTPTKTTCEDSRKSEIEDGSQISQDPSQKSKCLETNKSSAANDISNSKISSSSMSEQQLDVVDVHSKQEESPIIETELEATSEEDSEEHNNIKDISRPEELSLQPKTDEGEEGNGVSLQLDSGLQSMQSSSVVEVIEDQTKRISAPESYPGQLNPFGDDEDAQDDEQDIKQSTNPFDDDEDVNDEPKVEEPTTPKYQGRRLIKLRDEDIVTFTPGSIQVSRISEVYPTRDSVEFKKPIPAIRKKIPATRISLSPFWDSDEEDLGSRESKSPRSSAEHQQRPRVSDVSSSITSPYGSSTTSLSSITTSSSVQSGKKKKAPPPPSKPPTLTYDSEHNSSPSTSVQSTPRPRKSKMAPAPPALASTPSGLYAPHPKISVSPIQFDNEKITKDELNRNRQSQIFNEPASPTSPHIPDKSTYGKWKRKKNAAPGKPVAIRRTIKELPMVEVKRELDIIEVQQQGLERQGVKLEHLIRMRCECVDAELNEDNIPIEVEDMILQLFEVVNEKNELCRRQAELMYLKKQHRLEEEHAEVEYQIRCLMLTPDKNKTDTDKSKEEELIKRLIEIVEKKNEIIECLDMDRVREHEEDHSFTSSMNSYANRRDGPLANNNTLSNDEGQALSKKEKKKFKKKFKLRLGGGGSHQHAVDADKDIDETELNQPATKEKKKKKFAIF